MSNYYEYESARRNIVRRLHQLNGWTVYGWHADESDSYTDYYCPESWGGVAEKNGYILCVGVYGAVKEPQYYTKNSTYTLSAEDRQKIEKLSAMTEDRGASAQEAETAQKKIDLIRAKAENAAGHTEAEKVLICPSHMAHPTGANWHIEKDGIIIDKGNGILNWSNVMDITDRRDLETWQKYNTLTEEEYKNWYKDTLINSIWGGHYTEEQLEREANYRYANVSKKVAQLEKFNQFINKIDTLAGGLVGKGGYTYEKYTETVYKDEKKAQETTTGEIKEGQYFILKSNFTYGCNKGSVYKITNVYENSFSAYKLNGKLTKICTGSANSANHFGVMFDRFNAWIEKGAISYCDIIDVKTPYQVEKVRKVKNDSGATTETTTETATQAETATEATAETKTDSAKDYTITDGTREGAQEIYFTAKPSEATLTALKNAGMHWNLRKKCWFGFITREELEKLVA